MAHVPVLAREALEALTIRPDGRYLDGTFGRGGHSRLILGELGPEGRLLALDQDPAAIEAGQAVNDPRFTLIHTRFSQISEALAAQGWGKVDGILLDIGVSSPQLDEAERGFSFRLDGALDMRMDPQQGVSAAEWLAEAEEKEIEEVVRSYGEERFARQIARTIAQVRKTTPIRTTRQLAQIVAGAVRSREPGQHPATRTFQALRIYINRELEELKAALPVCVENLRPGGRLAVISFHSLEDRIVKRFMREEAAGEQVPARLPVRAADLKPARLRVVGRAVHASPQEVANNPRARSAVLRVAERVE
ncbi:MAG TPA: 16S rRNA (cytosine(1402)-N(4))-methyltransferase RsmH [Thiobacillaceae bacterium]|nr:16S rRNA (cytosine(1402)-N(4))-methyltransferase RsmH [Thiobacillaceae bacterium]